MNKSNKNTGGTSHCTNFDGAEHSCNSTVYMGQPIACLVSILPSRMKASTPFTLLIVDPQNDFCHPSGSLYVPGADADLLRLCNFIDTQSPYIEQIVMTRDEHQVLDIAHPCFWVNGLGESPEPFTAIRLKDVQKGDWMPVSFHAEVVDYLTQLEQGNELTHVVWPEHCLAGSWGAAISDPLMKTVADWAREGRFYTVVSKGQNPLTEHFGALRANVMFPDDLSTQVNTRLAHELTNAPLVVVAGEAQSHCVAQTLKQMMELADMDCRKIVVLTDCMSDVPGFDQASKPVFEEAEKRGVIFAASNAFTVE